MNNLTNKEDFDNLLILVSNNYLLNGHDFRDTFTRVPFAVPNELNDENIANYLATPAMKEKFEEAFPNYSDIGFDSVWDAIYICFINSIKSKLTNQQLEDAIILHHNRMAKLLARRNKAIEKEDAKKRREEERRRKQQNIA